MPLADIACKSNEPLDVKTGMPEERRKGIVGGFASFWRIPTRC